MNAVASRNVKFISHSDQGGRGDGVQIMVHRGYAYIGHGYSNGITVLDVRDLKNPKPVAFLPCPPDTRAIHLQTHDDLLLAVNGPSMWTMQVDAQAYYSGSPADLLKGRQYTAGVRVFDIAHPEAPREIAFMATEGVGPHRIWYVGGRYAYVSIHYPEFTDQVLAIADVAEPTRPEIVGKWWIPLSTAVSFTGGTDGFESVFPSGSQTKLESHSCRHVPHLNADREAGPLPHQRSNHGQSAAPACVTAPLLAWPTWVAYLARRPAL